MNVRAGQHIEYAQYICNYFAGNTMTAEVKLCIFYMKKIFNIKQLKNIEI